ncbi:MAG TPA: queuosine precursor transporter [Chloroflexota bacterium]|nr:queuosine precursor transporter [Chloroflexota bacterium]
MEKSTRLLPVITALFVTALLTANIIAVKLFVVAGVVLPAGVVVFPLSYLFGDVLTEVYGYAQARRVIWLGFFCNLLMVVAIYVGQILPPAGFWQGQGAYESILGFTPRLLVASFIAYLIGEFANSFVLAKLKILTRGRWLWTRTISSTAVGQALDSSVFITIAFAGSVPDLGSLILAQWLFKTLYEIVATPLTYVVVNRLKRAEKIDTFDYDTNFSPVSVT